ncbi:DEAD/DEAH box helicase family protein [Amphibacillus jilinensis]|uniref:DEAD/DEAH box helicase family protein n=1 Tax=Amphibacillus jilinensis TaxID=1216008 RepID=UPI0002DD49AB|nr:DEAD/DEAH box helicase family protein [Amphibacillus jilinensis]
MACTTLYLWTGPTPVWPQVPQPMVWSGHLTRDQQKASNWIYHAIETGQTRLLIHAVCGAGKTEMLFEGIALALKSQKRICLATPRADVVRELLPRFEQAFSGVKIVGLYGGSGGHQQTGQLTIATTHQLLRYQQAFDVMIIDEVDAFPFHADASLPYATKRAQKHHATTIYLTATPREKRLKRLPTIFVPVRYHGYPLPVPQLKIVPLFDQSHGLTSLWKWHKGRTDPSRQLLIFTATIKRANLLFPVIKRQHPTQKVMAVHANDTERIDKVRQFRDKQLDILITTTILERGVTFPAVDVVVLQADHHVFDQAALVQIAGRAGRDPNDPNGDVIFICNGKTKAIAHAVKAIERMNKKAGF